MISQHTVNDRINELKNEFEKGQNHLIELNQKCEETRHTMARIDGAIKVLEELLENEPAESRVEPTQIQQHVEKQKNSEFYHENQNRKANIG